MRDNVTPMERLRFGRTVDKVRIAFESQGSPSWEEFDTAWRLGRSYTLERAADEALSMPGSSPALPRPTRASLNCRQQLPRLVTGCWCLGSVHSPARASCR